MLCYTQSSFEDMVNQINSPKLLIGKETAMDAEFLFLDLHLSIISTAYFYFNKKYE